MDAKGEKPSGVDVVIGKPVTFDALQGAILQVVARDRRPPRSAAHSRKSSPARALDTRAGECYERPRQRQSFAP